MEAKTMDLDDVLALRPVATDSASIAAAIARAEAARADTLARAEALAAEIPDLLLVADNASITAKEAEAVDARRTVERIDVLLEAMRQTLPEAERQERIAAFAADAQAVHAKGVNALNAWLCGYAEAAERIAHILRLMDEAHREAVRVWQERDRLVRAGFSPDELPTVTFAPGDALAIDPFGNPADAVQLPGPMGELNSRAAWKPKNAPLRFWRALAAERDSREAAAFAAQEAARREESERGRARAFAEEGHVRIPGTPAPPGGAWYSNGTLPPGF